MTAGKRDIFPVEWLGKKNGLIVSIGELESVIESIKDFTGSDEAGEPITLAYEKYSEIKETQNKDLVINLLGNLKWLAEDKRSADAVKKGAEIYLSDPVLKMSTKYSGYLANEVFESIGSCIHESLDKKVVSGYVNWMGKGPVGKLLDFANEINGNQNDKMKRDIVSLLYVGWGKTELFDKYASKISLKSMVLEKKVELLSILRDIVNTGTEGYADALTSHGLEKLGSMLRSDLRFMHSFGDAPSIKIGIKFMSDMKTAADAPLLIDTCQNFGGIEKWMRSNDATAKVIGEMKAMGFDADFYVASGKVVSYKKGDAHYSTEWRGAFRSIMFSVLGSKKDKTLPKVSIPGISGGRLYKEIAKEYQSALNGDKDSARRVISCAAAHITKNFDGKKMSASAVEILDRIGMLEKVLDYGGTVTFRGARITARVWKRIIPDDLYDSEILRCCIFLPNGEKKEEIAHFILDPKTTLVQFYIDGIKEPVAAATFYAGKSEGMRALLVDTFEAGSLAYAALPYAKMQRFALDTMLKFSKKVNAERLVIFAEAAYGRPEEFCRYLREQQFKSRKVDFEAIDAEDAVLSKYSKSGKHHYTDAFEYRPLKGKINAFVLELKEHEEIEIGVLRNSLSHR